MSAAASPASAPTFKDEAGADRLVLVTGANGFIAAHTVSLLLQHGYRVRGSVRNPADAKANAHLLSLPGAGEHLELVAGDLTKADGWQAAVEGCDFVLHMASPFALVVNDIERDLIRPAVDGTLHVLRAVAATNGRVRRVVLTSSMAAVVYGHQGDARYPPEHYYTERDWSNEAKTAGYMLSKLKAERAAWDFVKSLNDLQRFELVTINPVGVLGPLMQRDKLCASVAFVPQLLKKEVPAVPRIGFSIVDVRDVALAHVRAMYAPGAAGERFLCCPPGGSVWMAEVVAALAAAYKPRGYDVPTGSLPSWLVKIAACFKADAAVIKPDLDRNPLVDGSKLTRVLGIQYRTWQEALMASAEDSIRLGLVPRAKKDQL